MYNFFIEKDRFDGSYYHLDGKDYNHAKNVLRLKVGEQVLISHDQKCNLCEISKITDSEILLTILESDYMDTSLPINIYLFQGLPKSDKLELIIQKAVELGADAIIPVDTARSIVKIEEKKKESKTARWQAIAESASKQSKRTSIPKVYPPMSFKNAIDFCKDLDLVILPYENSFGMECTKDALKNIKSGMKIGIFIGPEGGFEQSEVDLATESGAKVVSLGKRILRTETAAITALSMIMLYAETYL
ncbi:MAG: 16S rRNA (uracil(1498)-N(3))-methyltransferase [Clostridia bacterium]|nr:16S rRNA (uracil(1498)-N(3))-methyltransferase [Clostridia bacterium]